MDFGFFKKINSLVLSGIGAKQKFLWSLYNILRKLHVCGKSTSQDIMIKMALSQLNISIF